MSRERGKSKRLRPTALVVTLLASTLLAGSVRATEAEGRPDRAPPQDAPNILIVMTDDVGFAASSTFGGAIPTPTFDQLAANGLRYNNFHTAALCSPTRAALLTGRDHHAVNFGTVPELSRPVQGYSSILPKSADTIGQILSSAGYDTAWFGKHHNVPTWQEGPLGPFDQWANTLGFGYFYGFHGGLTDQFAPALIENDRAVEPPRDKDYILDRDLADHAIDWLRMQHAVGGDRPFLLYYAPGTAHAPVQAPADWIARFRGKFDGGWDVYRNETFARQKRLGLIPANARLAPLPSTIKPWKDLTPDEKRVAARFMEAYAAALAYCDNQIGRVIEELRLSGRLDNTLVLYIQGDNGASAEGGDDGLLNYGSRLNGRPDPKEELAHSLAHLDDIGGPRSYEVGPAGWAAAMDTPFPYYKTVASRLGGTTNGMVVSWPARIKARGLRPQFTDVTDILPTVLDAAGLAAPAVLNGVAQQPFDGTSFAYSFADAAAPSRHRTQYFEIFGHAAIYHDGWLAASQVADTGEAGASSPKVDAPWQLYHLAHDYAQTRDIAARHPEKLAELRALFHSEAERKHVLPFFTDPVRAMLPGTRPEITAAGTYVFYPSSYRYPEGAFPSLSARSWSIDADIEAPRAGAQGMLATQGGRFGGWGLALFKGAPTFLYRTTDRDSALLRLSGPALAPGRHHIVVSFNPARPGVGQGGDFKLTVDDQSIASAQVARTAPLRFMPDDAAIGRDTGVALTDDYQAPFAFDGLHSLKITIGPLQLAPGPREAPKGGPHEN